MCARLSECSGVCACLVCVCVCVCESVFMLEIVNVCVTYSHTWACYYVTPYMRKLPANVWHNTHQVLPNSYTQHNYSCCMGLLLKHFFFKPLLLVLNPQRMQGPGEPIGTMLTNFMHLIMTL